MRVWFIDEHRYGLISHQRQCWGMRRVRPHAPYRTKYEWGYVASALEVEGRDEALCVFLPTVSQESSAAFLREISALDAHATHIVIQDQAGFHLKEGDARLPANVRLLPLPPYSPELNPVERIGDLIKDATGNRVFATLELLEAAIEGELRPLWQSKERVRSLVGQGSIRSQVNAFYGQETVPFLCEYGIKRENERLSE